jgi:hypothetical protein
MAGDLGYAPARQGRLLLTGQLTGQSLNLATTSRGKRPGAARSGEFVQANQAFGKESLAP